MVFRRYRIDNQEGRRQLSTRRGVKEARARRESGSGTTVGWGSEDFPLLPHSAF